MWRRHHGGVPVAVVDVGSNTVRVQVADGNRTLFSERELLRLGADIELHGEIPPDKLESTAAVVAGYVADARAAGAKTVEVLIASPGRQAANGEELARLLELRSGCHTRILSSAEEGQLAFLGALSCAGLPSGRLVGVVDVGGGSAQVVVGSRKQGPVWWRSIDLGSQRLTSRLLQADPPGHEAVAAARAEVERYLEDFEPRQPRTALAVGGSARALKRLAGGRLGPDELEKLIDRLAVTPIEVLGDDHSIGEQRARTLAAGAIILSALQRRLGTPLRVQRGGLREGALLALAAQRELAA